jgi:hypothetical protein
MNIISHSSWNETVITQIWTLLYHVYSKIYRIGCVRLYNAVTFVNAPSCGGFKALSELSFEVL